MKTVFATGIAVLALVTSYAQVTVGPLGRDGELAWTNMASLPHYYPCDPYPGSDADPIYRVEWAAAPAGPWIFATNTSATSISMTDFMPVDQPSVFYRVAWTNGQVWNYQGYQGDILVATGKLYFKVAASLGIVVGGSWAFSGSQAGPIMTCWDQFDGKFTLRYVIDDGLWLEGAGSQGPDLANGTWTGRWVHDTIAGGYSGTFTAERADHGQ